jgi:putative phosphoesterase
MKIVLFSDIHANLPALEAFWEDIETFDYDLIFCLGDLVGYNIWPNEVIKMIKDRKIPTIMGNHDAKAIGISKDDSEIKNYAYSIIDEAERSYLANLPAHIQLNFETSKNRLLLVHGSPWSNKEYITKETPDETIVKYCRDFGANILCFGHTHKPFHRVIKQENDTIHAINIGSVGKPKDGNPDGCYVVLKINNRVLEVEFRRLKYDVEMAAKAIENSPLQNEFAVMLRQGY